MTDPVPQANDLPADRPAAPESAAVTSAAKEQPGERTRGRGKNQFGSADRGGPKPAARPTPAGRRPHPVLQRLFELYPKMFGARFRPLKLGVFQELMARHSEEFKKEDLKLALGLHARSTRYLESMAAGEKRHDLNGEPVEDVAPEHVYHAILEVFRRRQGRAREDMRPWLRERLVRAIEASGLSRQEYAERFGSADPQVADVLQSALTEAGERAAKQEALRRAFEASGRTPAEFADMYGMDLAVVRRALSVPTAAAPRPAAEPLPPGLAALPEEEGGASGASVVHSVGTSPAPVTEDGESAIPESTREA